MEPLVIEREPSSDLPAQVGTQRLERVAIRQPLQGLQHQHRRHQLSRLRRATPARREHVSEHLIGKQPAAMLSQERIHTPLSHKVAHQGSRVEEFTIRIR